MLKDKLLSYIKEKTREIDFQAVDNSCTADAMSGIFGVKRNTVSHYLNQELGKSLFKVNTRPVLFFSVKEFEQRFFPVEKSVYVSLDELFEQKKTQNQDQVRGEKDPLDRMIGARGSLKKAVEQIKTSVFYPNTSLPIFLHGDTGAGKSYMARQIYEFSVCHKVLPEGAPFITLNCAQYANNVELLSSSLFGYVKGAFTGAYGTTKGLLEAADGGMLFLDEVHRLNNESQEKLFIFLDQGIFRRMGENEGWHKADVRIVMATTEDLDSNFLDTFLRRVPIVVEIPDLTERGIRERLQFIYQFFIRESQVLDRSLAVSGNVLDALAGHMFKGNVGELQNTIKYLCATIYAKDQERDVIPVRLADLPDEILSEIAQSDESKIKKSQEVLITPVSAPETISPAETEESRYYQELFEKLSSIYEEFQSQGYEAEQFEKRCFHAVNDMLDRLIYQQSSESDTMMMRYVISSVHEAFRYVEYSTNVRFGGNVLHAAAAYFFYLNSHPSEYESEKKISEEFLTYAAGHYKQETHLVKRMMELLSAKMDLNVTEAELLPLVLYFKSLNVRSAENRTRAVILAHGYATASSIANVANRLLEEVIFEAVDMPIDKKMEDIVRWMKEYIEFHDISSGILLLVDTGSLMDIYEELSDVLRVPAAIVNNISTQMAVNAGQMVKQRYHLEDIISRLEKYNQTEYQLIYPKVDKQKVLLTCCLTGTGTAEQIRGLIDDSIPDDIDISVISYDYDQLNNQSTADALLDSYDILGVIGTVNPQLSGVEFIPLEEVVSGAADRKMEKILAPAVPEGRIGEINDHLVRNFSVRQLIGSLTILDTDKIMNHIEECLKKYEVMTGQPLANSTKINLFIHVGCLAERLIRRSPIEDYPCLSDLEEQHTEEIAKIRSAFSGIEDTYSVKIPLSEIGYIYDIINGI